MRFVHLSEGWRYFRKSFVRKFSGPRRFSGSAKDICVQIVDACWNGVYFRNSVGHYGEFWSRDFGFSVDALLKLGYRGKVLFTLDYALSKFSKSGIKTSISPSGVPFSFPDVYSPDSVALLFYALRVSNAKSLVTKYRDFLQKEVEKFFKVVIDETGLVRPLHFSSMRDYSVRVSSCYDNVMVGLMAREAKLLGFEVPKKNWSNILKKHFWTGEYFKDELNGKHIAGDANVFPFWSGVVKDKKMLRSVVSKLQKVGLDRPFPLKYLGYRAKENMILLDFFVSGWEQNNVWSHMGPLFISLVQRVNRKKAEDYASAYRFVIERDGTLFELYNESGHLFKTLFYCADEGMLWAANLVDLL